MCRVVNFPGFISVFYKTKKAKMSFYIFLNQVEPVRDSHHQMKNPFMDSGIHHGFPHHVSASRLLTQNPHVDAGFLNGAFGTNFLHGGASAFTAHAGSNGPRYRVEITLFSLSSH